MLQMLPSNFLFCVTVRFDANVFSKRIPVWNKTSVLNRNYYFLQTQCFKLYFAKFIITQTLT